MPWTLVEAAGRRRRRSDGVEFHLNPMLARAGEERLDYGGGRTVSAELPYWERGLVLAFLAGWAAWARALAPRLGFPEAPSGR
ncbi:hypothetical protein ABT124_11225 [Streptomyces sp. NPDC001982]|uniref:hypothetical protein n=1 Tax=Streptomyces sp. NPDC001982 TaxID=3154405 RepID=UPI003324AD25